MTATGERIIQNKVFSPLKSIRRSVSSTWKKWKEFHSVIGRLFPYIRKNAKRLVLAQLAGFGLILMGILEPWPLKLIFDNIFLEKPLPVILTGLSGLAENGSFALIVILISSIVVIAFVHGVFYYYQQLLTSRCGQRISADIRLDLYNHLQRLSFSFHDRRRTGDLLSRLTTDIRILRQALISFPQTMVRELALMIGMILIMFIMDWRLTLLALAVVPLLGALLSRYRLPMKKAVHKQREREGHLASIASEVFGAIKVVQGFHREDTEAERFTVQNKSSLRSGLRAARLEAKLRWGSELAVALVMALVLGVAVQRVLTGALSPGDILVFIAYLRGFNRPLRRISRFTEQSARGAASGERILDMLKVQPTVKDRPGAITAGRLKGEIICEEVSFAYQKGIPVLHEINFEMRAGERLALVGPTGCGKSTIVSLIPRFYDPTDGRVLIDGIDVRDYSLNSLRKNIAMVFQEPVLFATTIAENIGYGKVNASFAEIEEAAKKADIHHIIQALPDGYETVLGERGGTLSGGQRQCVAIARAIIKDSPMVILDEPTAGLDSKSASLVMSALQELMRGKTVLVISHNLEAIKDVDRVLVLSAGRLIQDGRPSEVPSDPSVYEQIQGLKL